MYGGWESTFLSSFKALCEIPHAVFMFLEMKISVFVFNTLQDYWIWNLLLFKRLEKLKKNVPFSILCQEHLKDFLIVHIWYSCIVFAIYTTKDDMVLQTNFEISDRGPGEKLFLPSPLCFCVYKSLFSLQLTHPKIDNSNSTAAFLVYSPCLLVL